MMMTRMMGAEAEEGVTEFLWQRHTVMPPFKQTTHDPTIYDDHRLSHNDTYYQDQQVIIIHITDIDQFQHCMFFYCD